VALGSTAGPGGFGPSPAFGKVRTGVHLVPAQTTPRPGVYSGPSTTVTGHSPWLWLALLAVALVLTAVTLGRWLRPTPGD
jgi:hypothetical protein